MRAFLREPSTPWIVFDQEGRPPSQLAVGEVLPRAFSSVFPDHGFFPSTEIIDSIPQSKVEPSSLAVASDLSEVDEAAIAEGAEPLLPVRRSRRFLGVAAAAVAIVSMIGVGAFALNGASPSAESATASAPAKAAGAQAKAMPPELAPPELAPAAAPAPAPPPNAAVTAPAAAAPVATPPSDESPAKAAARKWARLSTTNESQSRGVFLDGKRLLGKGARSFTISCGAHTIAVGSRTDTREVDLPCTGTYELVVTK